jgi:hypothetical protein
MKLKNAVDLEAREPSFLLTCVKIFIVYPAFVLLACIPLLALFTISVLQKIIAGSMSLLAGVFGGLSALFSGLLWFAAYAIWLLLRGEWGQLLCLLPELLDWLRSVGFR